MFRIYVNMLSVFISIVLYISSAKGVKQKERYLDAPKLVSVTGIEPAGLYVEWETVRQRCDDPVIGYKIRIYEIPGSSESEFKLINAEQYPGLVKNEIPSQKFSINSTSPATREVTINGEKTKATVDKIKLNTLYEVRVLAFKIDVEGPMSEPVRIKLLKDTGYQAVVSRTLTGCQISVPTDDLNVEDETYPHIYNSYF